MDIDYLAHAFVRLLEPLGLTIALSLVSLLLATLLGVAIGTIRAFLKRCHPLTWLIDSYTFAIRGTPILVTILAAYFVPAMLGISVPLFWIGVLALTVNSTAFIAEIARAAVQSIPRGQLDAGLALGLSRRKSIWLVVMPQAVRRMIPPVASEFSQLIKGSAVLSVIAVFELHKASQSLIGSSFKFLEVFAVESAMYLVFIQSVLLLAHYLERSLAKSARR